MNISPVELREKGLRLLIDEFGTVGTVNFLRQFDSGSGNYTEERDTLLSGVIMDEIVERIKQRKAEQL